MICDDCAELVCTVCGHEACPCCEVDCDHPDCIVWDANGSGNMSHVCTFPPCPRGCVRKFSETVDRDYAESLPN